MARTKVTVRIHSASRKEELLANTAKPAATLRPLNVKSSKQAKVDGAVKQASVDSEDEGSDVFLDEVNEVNEKNSQGWEFEEDFVNHGIIELTPDINIMDDVDDLTQDIQAVEEDNSNEVQPEEGKSVEEDNDASQAVEEDNSDEVQPEEGKQPKTRSAPKRPQGFNTTGLSTTHLRDPRDKYSRLPSVLEEVCGEKIHERMMLPFRRLVKAVMFVAVDQHKLVPAHTVVDRSTMLTLVQAIVESVGFCFMRWLEDIPEYLSVSVSQVPRHAQRVMFGHLLALFDVDHIIDAKITANVSSTKLGTLFFGPTPTRLAIVQSKAVKEAFRAFFSDYLETMTDEEVTSFFKGKLVFKGIRKWIGLTEGQDPTVGDLRSALLRKFQSRYAEKFARQMLHRLLAFFTDAVREVRGALTQEDSGNPCELLPAFQAQLETYLEPEEQMDASETDSEETEDELENL